MYLLICFVTTVYYTNIEEKEAQETQETCYQVTAQAKSIHNVSHYILLYTVLFYQFSNLIY